MSDDRMTVILEGKELEAAKQWWKTHRCKPDAQRPSDNSNVRYCFTPGGIGTAVVITCLLCSQSENVTDFDVWNVEIVAGL
jgi:hypothetical protein